MKMPVGKSLANTQTSNSPGVYAQGPGCTRGERMNPPKGAKFPGKGLSSTQTRNSLTSKR